jgi:hypothetical protein
MLISVLFSSFPLDQGLALALHRVALDLYRRKETAGLIDHDLAHGTVTNLHNHVALGTITGPTFEAELDTERGAGQVRFILTRQGLDLLAVQEQQVAERGAPAKYLN